ncbi:MAG: hypothetical protein EB082_12755, partial [Verrucomicrobia bacterium]|nr:hypothetical protein [Verrucomicrobiota bacterium]
MGDVQTVTMSSPHRYRLLLSVVAATLATFPLSAAAADFISDIFPILQRSCFECHDAKQQKGKLRL